MKAILISFVLLATSLQAISQCDKKVTWYASKERYQEVRLNTLF